MGFARIYCAITLRSHRRELIGTVVLLGLLGGLSLLSLAGARRTQSAYPRLLRASHASTMAIDPGRYDPKVDAAIASRPEVLRSATYVAFTTGVLVHGSPDFNENFETLGTPNGRFFTMDRFAPTSGRLPDVRRSDEIAVNETAAQYYGYRVGQHLDLGTYSQEQVDADSFFEHPPPPKIRTHVTIVGIGRFTDEVVQDDTNRAPLALVTPAFSKTAAAYATYAWQGLELRHGDADVGSVKAWYVARSEPGTPQFFRVTSVDTYHVEQATRPVSLALGSFGVIALVATLLLVGQTLNRWLRTTRGERDVLRSFGARAAELAAGGLVGPMLALVLGTLTAVGVAYLASPLMPVGAVRRVEVARGFDADWTVLGIGAAAIFAVLAAVAGVTAASELRRRPPTARREPRRSRLVGTAMHSGMPPSAVTGMRFAFEPGDGANVVSARSVMVACTTAITAVVAALTFGASFHTLVDSPDLFGWNWDSAVFDSGGYGGLSLTTAHQELDGRAGIAGWSGAYFGADSVDGRNVPLLGMEPGSEVTPPLLSGRMLAAGNEIVLGSATADALGKHEGDEVRIGVGAHLATLRVVGTMTFPTIGISHGAHTSLGTGALVVPDLIPGFDRGPSKRASPPVLFVRFTSRAHRRATATNAALTTTVSSMGEYPGSAVVVGPQRPAEIVNSSEVGGASAVLASMLAAAAAISLALSLGASVRRRRHELALLRSLGFTRRQLAASLAWQATATSAVGVLAGVPLGIALGRVLWSTFAKQLDVVPHPSVPIGLLLLATVGALAIGNVAAVLPAHLARRVEAGAVLRTE